MAIRRMAAVALTFSLATGALLIATQSPAEATAPVPQHADCVPWPYRPCPPPGPHDHDHDHDRDRDRDRGRGSYEEFEEQRSYEEYLEVEDRSRSARREATPPEVHRVTATPAAPVGTRVHRDSLPRTGGAPVVAVGLGGLALVTAGAVVVAGRRRGTRYY